MMLMILFITLRMVDILNNYYVNKKKKKIHILITNKILILVLYNKTFVIVMDTVNGIFFLLFDIFILFIY